MSVHKSISVVLLAFGLAAGGLVFESTGAFAERVHRPLMFSPFGSVASPSGLAVDQSDGNLYVVDSSANVVRAFGEQGGVPADGVPATLLDPAKEPFAFNGIPSNVAVDNACTVEKLDVSECDGFDPSNGDIYVVDVFAGLVDKFRINSTHEYEYVCHLSGYVEAGGVECQKEESQPEPFSDPVAVAVDRKGDVYVGSFAGPAGGGIYEFNPEGEPVGALGGIATPQSIAIDSTGDVFSMAFRNGPVIESKRSSFTGAPESTSEIVSEATGLASDLRTGSVLVDLGPSVREYNAKDEVESEFGGGVIGSGTGVAVNEVSGDVYVSDEAGQHVDAFGPLITVPDVTTGAASNVTATGASLAGTVNPDNTNATTSFQYGFSTAYGQSATGTPSALSGNSTSDVTINLSELEPNATYHYRLVASNSEGVSYGEDETFVTPSIEPFVSTTSATLVSPTVALLYGTVNGENGGETTYRFLYGTTTAYGSSGPSTGEVQLGSFYADRQVVQTIEGLEPDTTYHYTLAATNLQGTTTGADATFTTGPLTPPIIETESANAISQTGVTLSCTLDPRGAQTMYEFDLGFDTSYGTKVFGNAGFSSGPVSIAANFHNLAAGTTYHYRVITSNIFGTTYGPDQTFTTPEYPAATLTAPVPTTLIPVPTASFPQTSPTANTPRTKQTEKKKQRKQKTEPKKGKKATRSVHRHAEIRRGKR